MEHKFRLLYNQWFHYGLCGVIQQAYNKEELIVLLHQLVSMLEKSLLEEEYIPSEDVKNQSAYIIKKLDAIINHEEITDEAVENSSENVINIIYDAISVTLS